MRAACGVVQFPVLFLCRQLRRMLLGKLAGLNGWMAAHRRINLRRNCCSSGGKSRRATAKRGRRAVGPVHALTLTLSLSAKSKTEDKIKITTRSFCEWFVYLLTIGKDHLSIHLFLILISPIFTHQSNNESGILIQTISNNPSQTLLQDQVFAISYHTKLPHCLNKAEFFFSPNLHIIITFVKIIRYLQYF